MTTKTATEAQEATEKLREWIQPGDTIWTILRHVSSSGMTRAISPIAATRDNHASEPHDISYWAARATGRKINQRHGGITCGGCGMDMGFDLVYSLSRALYPDGFGCIGAGCPSNDHSNGDRDYTPGHTIHRDGGYALKQRWL